jgi:hypothetical protein
MNTIPTTDAGQLALPWHTASFASATGLALQKRQKPLARTGFPRFDQLRFQSGQATGRARAMVDWTENRSLPAAAGGWEVSCRTSAVREAADARNGRPRGVVP